MSFTFNHLIVFLPISISLVILTAIIIFLVKGKKSLLLFSFIFLIGLMFLWTFGQIGQYVSGNDLTTWISLLIIYTGICFLGVSWVLFVLVYTNNPLISNGKKVTLLFIPSVLTWFGLITNPYHHLFFTVIKYDPGNFNNSIVQYGLIFWLTALIAYFYCIAGVNIMIRYTKNQTGPTKKQSLILLLAPLLSIISAFFGDLYLFVSKNPGPSVYDQTPAFFTVAILLMGVAAYRYRFLDILPGALQEVVENIDDAVLIIDDNNFIVKLNPSFRVFFQEIAPIRMNDPVSLFTGVLRENIEMNNISTMILEAMASGSNHPVEGDICLLNPEKRYFEVKIRPLMAQNKLRGRIITFNDITDYKSMLHEIREKNTQLSAANQALNEHLNVIEELAIANERTRIARELHDSLGHTLMLVIMLLRAGRIESEKDMTLTLEKLDQGINTAEEGLRELRRSITGMLANEMKNSDIIDNLQRLIADSINSGIQIEFTVFGREYYQSFLPSVTLYKISDVIYKIAKEAITNAFRHGKATRIDVVLRFGEGKIKLFIVDNGCGCKEIIHGFGLTGMQDRVKTVNGTIVYGSDGEHGFNIHAEIPLEGLKK